MPPKKQQVKPSLYQIKVVLSESTIWRRIRVKSDITLRSFHRALQEVMGWTNSHLHRFTYKSQDYGYPDPDKELKIKDDRQVQLDEVVTGEGQCFMYEYDMGDSWQHYLHVEKILPVPENTPLVLCTGGEWACPPEDVGGMDGYEDFLKIIADPKHPEHKETLEWAGGAFHPKAFDMNRVNRKLRSLLRPPRRTWAPNK